MHVDHQHHGIVRRTAKRYWPRAAHGGWSTAIAGASAQWRAHRFLARAAPQARAATATAAITSQNDRRALLPNTGGRPGDRNGFRVDRLDLRVPVLDIIPLAPEVLRRPIESTQHLSIRYTKRSADAGIEASVGSRGDSYHNALAESLLGLYKAEVIHHNGPWKSLEHVECATLEWVSWFNTARLLEPIGYQPPPESATQYYATTNSDFAELVLK
jgi:transposase InsO family protein